MPQTKSKIKNENVKKIRASILELNFLDDSTLELISFEFKKFKALSKIKSESLNKT